MRIGADIGGTTIKGALFDGETILAKESVPTMGQSGREVILSQLYTLLDRLYQKDVTFIGISSAGNIDPRSGKCVYATDNLRGWTGTEIASSVRARYHTECRADNDAVCALLGETAGDTSKDVTMLTFGTGVGGASIVNGKVLRGEHFDAARWGHFVLYPQGRLCNCGKRGCAEQYLSAMAFLKDARRRGMDVQSCEEIVEKYLAGDGTAKKAMEKYVADLHLLLENIRTAIAPQRIVLGGGLMNAWDVFGSCRKMPPYAERARLGGDAGIYGACLLDTVRES